MLVFGGGSVAHCNDELWMLDVQTLEWSRPAAEGPVPPPRAGAWDGDAAWGGAGLAAPAAACTQQLLAPAVGVRAGSRHGAALLALAGHAAAILGNTWFVVGGGNNTSGCADMYALDLSPLPAGGAMQVRAGLGCWAWVCACWAAGQGLAPVGLLAD